MEFYLKNRSIKGHLIKIALSLYSIYHSKKLGFGFYLALEGNEISINLDLYSTIYILFENQQSIINIGKE